MRYDYLKKRKRLEKYYVHSEDNIKDGVKEIRCKVRTGFLL
jgi:hypothetical protein